MHGTAAIESINVEQIATVTDLLLLRARRTRRRFSTNRIAFVDDRTRMSRPSYQSISIPIPSSSAPATSDFKDPDPELTLFVRARKVGTSTISAAIVASVFAVGILVTSLL